jgi:hypothetical protein
MVEIAGTGGILKAVSEIAKNTPVCAEIRAEAFNHWGLSQLTLMRKRLSRIAPAASEAMLRRTLFAHRKHRGAPRIAAISAIPACVRQQQASAPNFHVTERKSK